MSFAWFCKVLICFLKAWFQLQHKFQAKIVEYTIKFYDIKEKVQVPSTETTNSELKLVYRPTVKTNHVNAELGQLDMQWQLQPFKCHKVM